MNHYNPNNTNLLARSTYKVSATWALDMDQYNEWMNEEDYEVDDNGDKKVHKYGLSVESVDDLMTLPTGPTLAKKQKRKRSPTPPKSGKRKRYIWVFRKI